MRLDPVVIRPDDTDKSQRLYVLHQPVRYEISGSQGWFSTVPQGFRTDLTSGGGLTRLIIRVLGLQHSFDAAAVPHDWLYATHLVSRAVADALFYQILRDEGAARWKCKLAHITLQLTGWRAYKTGPDRLVKNSPELAGWIATAPAYEGI